MLESKERGPTGETSSGGQGYYHQTLSEERDLTYMMPGIAT